MNGWTLSSSSGVANFQDISMGVVGRGSMDQTGWMIRTLCVVADVNHTRADTEEEDAVLLVLGAELGGHDVHGGLGHGVQWADLNVVLVDPVDISHAGGDVDDLLDLALLDERDEGVVEVDVARAVDLEELLRDGLHLLWGAEGSDGLEAVEERWPSCVGDEVVERAAGDLGGLLGSRVEGLPVLEVAAHDADVTTRELGCHLLLCGGLVTNKSNDRVLGVAGDLAQDLELFRELALEGVMRMATPGAKLTPIPLETPVMR